MASFPLRPPAVAPSPLPGTVDRPCPRPRRRPGRSGAAPLLACALTLALGGTSALVSSDAGRGLPQPRGTWGRRGGVGGRAVCNTRRGGSLEASSAPLPPLIPSLPLREAAAAVLSDAFHAPGEEGDAMVGDELMPASFIAETALPTPNGLFRLRAYRIDGELANPHIGKEPCVIYSADPGVRTSGRNVPVRVHDQCLTSEVLGSQRCDCREQLLMGMDFVAREGGVVIYLQQEGRGIGLANKVAAYAMQDMGLDTVDANLHLGFPEDCRTYGPVPSILEDMGIESVQLLTNNPRKVDLLKSLGVDVSSTQPMVAPKSNQHNRRYLEAKVARMNHTSALGDMLAAENLVRVNSAMAPRVKNGIDESQDESIEEGVRAAASGYCFGRASVEAAVAAVKAGEMVVVVDDMDRENEGDLIMAADAATPKNVAEMVRYTSGYLCIALEGERMEELQIPMMTIKNEDPKGTAFGISVDATKKHGITTGISARDRAATLRLLGSPSCTSADLVRPGHIMPLRARPGGTLVRDGHTEASVDLARLAGRHPSGVLCEIVSEDEPEEMARLPELRRFCDSHGYVLTSIVDIAQYRRDTEDDEE